MPNGGSDCCGTCWFNLKNRGKPGYPEHTDDRVAPHCAIRDEPIEDPFYTYCANHPYHRPDRDPIPIGPILTAELAGEFGFNRVVWKESPDSEEIRQHLLDLLVEDENTTGADRYPFFSNVMNIVIGQLVEFRERRALEHLELLAEQIEEEDAANLRAGIRLIKEGGP